MGVIGQGPLKGFYAPDYDGGSIVNLLSSIIRSRGGQSPHSELAVLPASALAGFRKVVYLVVDGMGELQLERYLEAGGGREFLAANRRHTLTTVYPATTAAAVSTFGTGASPLEHALIGWYVNLVDLGIVSTILLARTRTEVPIAGPDFKFAEYLRLPSYIDSTRGIRELLSFGQIPWSKFSLAVGQWHRRWAFGTLAGMVRQIAAFARRPESGTAYAYWPGYDTYCHEHGCDHPKTNRHLDAIDRALAGLSERMRGTGAALLVTADHGLVDSIPEHRIELRDVPGFIGCLATLPAGDSRQVQCFVRPSRVKTFLDLVRRRLGKACVCVPGEVLLSSGLLGPGEPHPALAGRVGDFVLVAKDDYAFAASLPGAPSLFNVANHGGMSAREMRVPLYVAGTA